MRVPGSGSPGCRPTARRRRPSSTASAGNWRTLLERFAADRAPVYLRPAAEVSAALRALQAAGARLAVFTDAPEELARLALVAARRRPARRVAPRGCGRRGASARVARFRGRGRAARATTSLPACRRVRVGGDGAHRRSPTASSRRCSPGSTRSRRSWRGSTAGSSERGRDPPRGRAALPERVARRDRLRGARTEPAGPPPPRRLTASAPGGRSCRRPRPGRARPWSRPRPNDVSCCTSNDSRRRPVTFPPASFRLQIVPEQ